MLTNILRRGGAWRIAPLVVLAASILSFGLNGPSGANTAEAHQGSGLCGTGWWPTATFLYMWDDTSEYPGVHYHRWEVLGGGIHDEYCYNIY